MDGDGKKAQAGEGPLLSQAEARFALGPTLRATFGAKGHRPVVGTWDNKDVAYSFAALHMVTGRLTPRLLASPAKAKRRPRHSKPARVPQAFAAQRRDSARGYPATLGKPVRLTRDNAPWPQAAAITEVRVAHPHLQPYRLPSYSPRLKCSERLWRVLRRRATHKRLFVTRAELRTALRATLCYFHTMRHKVLSLLHSPRKQKAAKFTAA